MSEGILQLHSYSIPIRASPLLRSDLEQSSQFTILDIKQDHNPPPCRKKEMQRLRSKFQKKKEIDVPLSQELIVNL